MSYDRSESFDTYNATVANMAAFNGWNGTTGTVIIASGGTGFEGNALKCSHNTTQIADSATSFGNWYRLVATTASRTEYWLMLSVKITALPSTAGYYSFLSFDTGTSGTSISTVVAINVASDGSITARAGGSGGLLGTSSAGVIVANTRHHMAVRLKSHVSAGEVEVWIDGVQVLNLTSKNTTATSSVTTVNSVIFSGGRSASTSNATWYDDIILLYVDGTAPDSRIGDTQIKVVRPSADQSITSWTPSTGSTAYDLLDDDPITGTSDYVASSTVSSVLSVEMANITSTDNVRAVVAKTIMSKDDAGARTARARIDDGAGNVANGTTRSPPSGTPTLYTDYFGTTPAGGGWDATTVNALRHQVEVVS